MCIKLQDYENVDLKRDLSFCGTFKIAVRKIGWLLRVHSISVGVKTYKKLPTATGVLQMREGFCLFPFPFKSHDLSFTVTLSQVQERVLLSAEIKKTSQDV
jgi:hypothetical protein